MNIMKILINKGKQFEGDKLILIETQGKEAFNLSRWYLLVNQLAFNESNKYEKALQSGNKLWFEDATKEMIIFGKQGIDFLDDKNNEELEKFCIKWKLDFDMVKQTKLNDFEKEDENKRD